MESNWAEHEISSLNQVIDELRLELASETERANSAADIIDDMAVEINKLKREAGC